MTPKNPGFLFRNQGRSVSCLLPKTLRLRRALFALGGNSHSAEAQRQQQAE
jgi:hypothetical protein